MILKYFHIKSLLLLLALSLFSGTIAVSLSQNTWSSLDSLVNRYKFLYEHNKQKGNYSEALDNFRSYIAVKDSLKMTERANDLIILEQKYRNETKAHQISLLSREKELKETGMQQIRYSLFGITGLVVIILFIVFVFVNRGRLQANEHTLKTQQYLLRAQMNPHFIFNALTNIQGLIIQQDRESSLRYLSLFSDLTARIQEHSASELVKLEEELSLLHNYLEIQKLRYADKFEYEFPGTGIAETDEISIPPMFLQPFVENAIEHGFKYKEGSGMLSIRILKNEKQCVVIEIDDNGIGREKAKDLIRQHPDQHQGMATVITRERIDSLNRRKKNKITLEINDKKTSAGEPAGTLVRFVFPQKLQR